MTLQERMIAVYLRQANLPPEEKAKLKLFLALLIQTYDHDESDDDASPPPKERQTPKEARDEPVPFAERLIRAIDKRGLSQREAAREIGVSDVTIGKILKGHRCSPETTRLVREWAQKQIAPDASTDTEAEESLQSASIS